MRQLKIFMLLLAAVLISAGCRKMYDQVMEGVTVSLNTNNFLRHQVIVQVVNANDKSNFKPDPVITIEGEDAGKVYDINGGSSVVFSKGLAFLVVSPGQSLTGPASFTIKATAPGFETYEKKVVVTKYDTVTSYILPMIEKANAPNGVVINDFDVEVPANTGRTASPTIVIQPLDVNVEFPQRAVLSIPSGVSYFSGQNKKLSGGIKTTFLKYNTTDEVIATENPYNSKSYFNSLIKNGVRATDVINSPLSILRVSMLAGSTPVSYLSSAMSVTLEIGSGTYNLAAQRAYALGDQVDVYSNVDGQMQWQYLATVSFNTLVSGRPAATFNTTRMGNFILVPKMPSASSKLTLNFSRETKVNTSHFVLVTDLNDRKIFSYDLVDIFNGQTWTLPDFLPSASVKVKVFEFDFAGTRKGRQVVEYQIGSGSASFAAGVNPQSQLAPGLINANNLVLKFNLTVTCAGSSIIAQQYDGRILYKVNAADRYLTLGQSKNGYLETDRLLFGNTYFFSTTVSGRNANTGKLQNITYERARTIWRDPKLGSGPGAPGGIDIDYEVIGYFVFDTTIISNNGNAYDYYSFFKKSAIGGATQNWIAPASACRDFGY